jgi:hypothetical protein
MTERKRLKRLVRERMARTGETYTTARRHVLARATGADLPGLPAGLLPGYDVFGAERHRESALVAHVLRQAGVTMPGTTEPYSEPMVAGLGGGIGFMYFVFEYSGMPPTMTIVAQHHPEPWAPAVLGRLRVPHTEEHSGKPDAGLKKLNTALDAGRPAVCTVDRSRLPWHGMEPGFGQDPYVVVVAGRAGDDLFVDDDAARPNRMPAAAFAAAWSAHKKGRHHLLAVTGLPPAGLDLPAAVRESIGTTVAHLTGPVLGNNFDVNFGLSGMAKLAEQLRDVKTKTGWAQRFGAPVPFFHGVRRLYECLELEYTAPGATRPVYAEFLDEAGKVVSDAAGAYAEAAALFRESGTHWSRLASLALDTTAGLAEYAELAERRMELMCSQGATAQDEIRELTVRVDALAAEYAAADPLGDEGRRQLFDEMAGLVDRCLSLEQRAVDLLS